MRLARQGVMWCESLLKPLVRLVADAYVSRRCALGAALNVAKPALRCLKALLDPGMFGPTTPGPGWAPNGMLAVPDVVPEPVGGKRMGGAVPDIARGLVFWKRAEGLM